MVRRDGSYAPRQMSFIGRPATEREIARECFTSSTSTENWYLARALRTRGIGVRLVVVRPGPESLPCPSIAGARLGGERGPGHFVTVLARQGDIYEIGDPLVGRRLFSLGEARKRYYFTGFFMVVQP